MYIIYSGCTGACVDSLSLKQSAPSVCSFSGLLITGPLAGSLKAVCRFLELAHEACKSRAGVSRPSHALQRAVALLLSHAMSQKVCNVDMHLPVITAVVE